MIGSEGNWVGTSGTQVPPHSVVVVDTQIGGVVEDRIEVQRRLGKTKDGRPTVAKSRVDAD